MAKSAKWTKLEGTAIWFFAKRQMEREGLLYHNFDHILSLYERAAFLGMDYDEALDYAILFHDAVYDSEPSKELRSMQVAFDAMVNIDGAKPDVIGRTMALIASTAEHRFKHDYRLVILDLYGFTASFQEILGDNEKVIDEALNLHPRLLREEVVKLNRAFLTNLRDALDDDVAETREWTWTCADIVAGLTIFLEETETA